MLGPGLIGGSVLKAVRARFPETELHSWARRPGAVEQLQGFPGLVDCATDDLEKAIEGADLVILAMPTGAMASVVGRVRSFSRAGEKVIVTDVGSVKQPVVEEIGPLVTKREGIFLGSHPMAGSEKTGLEFADEDLLEEAAVILTPEACSDRAVEEKLKQFWELLGARVSSMDAGEHDRMVASISHLPHLVAASLVRVVMGEGDYVRYSGGGFRDTTRVSAGPEDMWAGILTDNHEAVSKKLGDLIEELQIWKGALDSLDRESLLRFLSEARKLREAL
ncbi:MAG: prephenate dehydrogenase/arogenate dehydrogenase family protein [Verrucomicrobiales bacterium]|nr:prephenate dehydrogenase/arogenate dehydrogenase family protein [Verrucomicrobiales bacterium]